MTDTRIKTPGVCPDCGNRVGVHHWRNCRILAEVITWRDRREAAGPATPDDPHPETRIQDTDLIRAGCGCSAILVDAKGTQYGGHMNHCRRSTWVTAVTKPVVMFADHVDTGDGPPVDNDHALWTAAWTDNTVSHHGTHLPVHAAAFQAMSGFTSWDEAAKFLDSLPLHTRPLGVFLAAARATVLGRLP